MIETLSLRNFKVLRDVNVRLRPLTLVVGPNGSGKSSILFALDHLVRHLTKRASFLDESKYTSRKPIGAFALSCSGTLQSNPFRLSLVFSNEDEWIANRNWKGEGALDATLNEPVFLDLDVRKLAAPSYIPEITYSLPPDGTGLSWFLSGLYVESRERFTRIVEALKEVVPNVCDLRLRRTLVQEGVGYELLFDMKGAEGIPSSDISEGTLITLALLAVLSAPNPPQLVLIDNLERGLHPKALGDLIAQIRSIQSQTPDLQIVATSHSPYLLDYLKADEVLLTSPDEEGYSTVKTLSDHPDYDRWKDVMAPGEFWSTVGESWVVQKS